MEKAIIETRIYSVKKRLLHVSCSCGKAVHLGGSLSMVDALTVLYSSVLKYDVQNPEWEDRDRFILSKGHCAIALYSVLAEFGYISESEMETFMQDDSNLVAHPVMNLQLGIESSNGSLGQGISMAVGIAQAGKIKNRNYKVYTLVGNGECDEGSVWEAAELASHYHLDNLTVIIDNNKLQSDGESSSVLDLIDIKKKWEAFGFLAIEIDGHDITQIYDAFTADSCNKPKAIICNTCKGHGISFMENRPEWHHNRLSENLYKQAIKELEEEYGKN